MGRFSPRFFRGWADRGTQGATRRVSCPARPRSRPRSWRLACLGVPPRDGVFHRYRLRPANQPRSHVSHRSPRNKLTQITYMSHRSLGSTTLDHLVDISLCPTDLSRGMWTLGLKYLGGQSFRNIPTTCCPDSRYSDIRQEAVHSSSKRCTDRPILSCSVLPIYA